VRMAVAAVGCYAFVKHHVTTVLSPRTRQNV